MIRIGTSGYTIAKPRYERDLTVVELNRFFESFPMAKTIERWKDDGDARCERIVCAPHAITHHADADRLNVLRMKERTRGNFQDSAHVRDAFHRITAIAAELRSRILFFELPNNLMPQADNVGRLQTFFKGLHRPKLDLVWQAPSHWPMTMVDQLSHALNLIPATNPLRAVPARRYPYFYYRVGDLQKGQGRHAFTDNELLKLKSHCRGAGYVIFNNGQTAFADAVRFQRLFGAPATAASVGARR